MQLLPEEKSVEAIERIYTALSENRYEIIRYTLTDGTEIEVRANSLGYHTSSDTSGVLNHGSLRISANWNYPLYMDKISSFEICGTVFELAPAES